MRAGQLWEKILDSTPLSGGVVFRETYRAVGTRDGADRV